MLLPLKQGLKLKNLTTNVSPCHVVMLLPLKQGLKHPLFGNTPYAFYIVVMLLPLKQGLKLTSCSGVWALVLCCYATSIKTRIETQRFPGSRRQGRLLLCYFH